VRNLVVGFVLLSALYGCSGGGILPSGPHAMDSARLSDIVERAARKQHISVQLVNAVINVESGGDPSAVSRAGAAGLMQLMPDTAVLYGVTNRFDPEDNVAGGTAYLHDLLARYHHNVNLALAAYNAGPGAVDASGGVPAYQETRAYVARVNAALHTN
jgi:soluble lytic murein transglycosylase-like protein